MTELTRNIKRRLRDLNMTQKDLGNKVGLSQPMIHRLLRAKLKRHVTPSFETLQVLFVLMTSSTRKYACDAYVHIMLWLKRASMIGWSIQTSS